MWFFLSLTTALCVASHDAWVKKQFSHLRPAEMMIYPMIYSLPLFVGSLFFVELPDLDGIFLACFLFSLPINASGFFLSVKAIRLSPLSLTVPYLAFTPVFMIFTGVVFLGEMPDQWGCAGIVSTCAGSYILNINPRRMTFLAPFAAFFKEPGARLMLLTALIYSFGAVIGKKGILHSSPMYFGMMFFTVHNLLIILFFMMIKKIRMKMLVKWPVKGVVAGLFLFLHIVTHSIAVSMTKAAYMVSVKRLSVLFSIIYGGVFFKEENMVIRLIGGFFMLAGAVVISLKGV